VLIVWGSDHDRLQVTLGEHVLVIGIDCRDVMLGRHLLRAVAVSAAESGHRGARVAL
jgi:hypothetical protein